MIQQLYNFSDLALVPAVKTGPERLNMLKNHVCVGPQSTKTRIGSEEAAFIAARDSFYLSSLGKNGQSYIQYRCGSKGCLHMLDSTTLGFAVYRGSRQYISDGSFFSSMKTCLSLTDYSSLRGLKIWAEADISEDLAMTEIFSGIYGTMINRIFLFHIRALDWNCQRCSANTSTSKSIRRASRQG
jgi:hypothetical protein